MSLLQLLKIEHNEVTKQYKYSHHNLQLLPEIC